jgi:hypothetical protein
MQRICKEQQAIAYEAVRSKHRRRAPAHRASADDEPARIESAPRMLDHRAHARFQTRHEIRPRGALLAVAEVEANYTCAARTQRGRELFHAAVAHMAAGAVRAYENNVAVGGSRAFV